MAEDEVDDVLLDPVVAPPLPPIVLEVAVVFEPAVPPDEVSSPPQACAAANGTAKMAIVQMSLRILHLL